MNRLFADLDRLFAAPAVAAPYPPLNVWEDDDHLFVEAELPGLDKDRIDLSLVDGNTLTVAGERKPKEIQGTWHRSEGGYGRFTRTVVLPAMVDGDAVSADYTAGVLTVTLPKSAAAKPKKIAVGGQPALTTAN